LRIVSQIEAFQRGHREEPDKPPKTEEKKEPLIPHMECLPEETQRKINEVLPKLNGAKREAFIRNITIEAKRLHDQYVSQQIHEIEASLKPQKPPSLFDKIQKVFQ
jgi:hypothetical protein